MNWSGNYILDSRAFFRADSDEEWMPSKAPCYYCGDKQAL